MRFIALLVIIYSIYIPNMQAEEKLHSEIFIDDHRDNFWNLDYLELVSKRLKFHKVKTVLDVGCGEGHWGQLLLKVLPEDAKLIGIDKEEEWIKRAKARAARVGCENCKYEKGQAEKLPYDDNTFDMVTAQTILMHSGSPEAIISEMIRVLKPGGILISSEVNNGAHVMPSSNLQMELSPEDNMKLIEFQNIMYRGKKKLGNGDKAIGELIPTLLQKAGLKNIGYYMSDNPFIISSPSINAAEKSWKKALLRVLDADYFLTWSPEQAKNNYLAIKGSMEGFEEYWQVAMKFNKSYKELLLADKFYGGIPGAGIIVLSYGYK